MELTDKVSALVRAAVAAGQRVRELVRAAGATNPVGVANKKVGMPATYRPVGSTCPSTCPQLPKTFGGSSDTRACLALNGNVQLHQVRASHLLWPSIRAATIAIVAAARWGQVARLHVSGDLCGPDGKLDAEYADALVNVANTAGDALKLKPGTPVAFGYTHLTREQLGDHWDRLFRAGIVFRFSGDRGPWGVVVHPDAATAPAKARELGATYCPEQAAVDANKNRLVQRTVTCEDCTLCWTRARPVLFRPSNGAKPHEDIGG